MGPDEIRSIRGARSRAAFARILGVTPLTVLRWELPTGNKEARRPRAKMLDVIRNAATISIAPGDDVEEDEDVSEERAPVDPEEARIFAIVERLAHSPWKPIEDELLTLLSSGALTTGRTLANLALIQIQLFVRSDVRAALVGLLPILEQVDQLSQPTAARAHVLAALLFASPDSRVFDPGRVNAHASAAAPLLGEEETDLHVILSSARISAARFGGPHAVARTYASCVEVLERATHPLGAALAAELRGMMAIADGDIQTGRKLAALAVQRAEELGAPGLLVAMLAHRAFRALAGSATPDDVLEITRRARAGAASVFPAEPMVRILAAEAEANVRAGRFAEAEAALKEGFAHANNVPIFPLLSPATKLFGLQQRLSDMDELLKLVTGVIMNTQLAKKEIGEIHLLHVRSMRAMFSFNGPEAAALSNQVQEGLDSIGGVGADYIIHDSRLVATFANMMNNDRLGVKNAMTRFSTLLEQRPSLWHMSMLRRQQARVHTMVGEIADARQKLETALATFELIGDVVQAAQTRMDQALAEKIAGAPDAEKRMAEASETLVRYGMARPAVALAPEMLLSIGAGKVWTPQSLAERVASGVERLAMRGMPGELFTRELRSVLGQLVPERDVVFEGPAEHSFDGFGVNGSLSSEERAAVRTIAMVAKLTVDAQLPRSSPMARLSPIEVDAQLPSFIAVAAATRRLKQEIAQLSKSTATILITGESGSGKEVVARGVHDLSARAKKPYVVFNCASVPRELFEGQLFGYRKGAFTGATSDSPGVIRAADGGTLFLDEIGELPLDTQPKLLRFLENGEVFPLGEQKPRKVDVRILAATHRDLAKLVREGTFREDLFYRLNVVPLFVPPLRERREDVVALAKVFIDRLAAGENPPDLSTDAVRALQNHNWPGNVRELRNVVERAMAYAPVPQVLDASHLRIGRA